MNERLQGIVEAVEALSPTMGDAAQARLDDLTKPQGSLGRLEELARQIYMVQQGPDRIQSDPARIYTIAGDHGVHAEGVSVAPQEVTRQMVLNFLNGGAGINVLAHTAGAELFVVDVGSCGGPYEEHPNLIQAKIAPGTANLAQGPAMSREQCLEALLLGVRLADEANASGVRSLGTGDMGIANTTPSTALYCAYLGVDPKDVVGPGTGLSQAGVAAKTEVVRKGLAANRETVQSGDPVAILAALGGLEIAALAGLIIGGAKNRQMVCVDGFISTAAYCAAASICPAVSEYSVISHASAEPGHVKAMKQLDKSPLLDLGFRLGEGTGAACALFLLRAACNMFNDMATFSEAGVSES